MAAATTTAAAIMASSISTSINTTTLKCTRSDPFLRISCSRSLQVGWIAHAAVQYTIIEPITLLSIGTAAVSHKWRVPRISAAVAQEEAAAAAAAEIEEEEGAPIEVEEEVSGDGEVEVESNTAVNTKLYFGNLPYNVDSAQLAGIIQDYGSPELIEVLYDRDTGRSRGFAFVTMTSIEDAISVIQNLDGTEYAGRFLRVNFSDKPKPKEPLYPETDNKLFVGNLSWSVTSESLKQVFQEYGNVVGARVLFDGETGRSRGYGFVSYATKTEMENAIESLNGVELEGRAIRVSLAQGKK